MINMGNEMGAVRPGDTVLCRGKVARVQAVKIHWAFSHPANCPIRAEMHAVEAVTAFGSRWAGAPNVGTFVGEGAMWDRRK